MRNFRLRVLANASTAEALQELDLGDTQGCKRMVHGA